MARGQNNHHVLPLFCDDLIASTVDMTPGCFGAYLRILCYAWTRGGVPNDEEACSRIAGGLTGGDWKVIRQRLVVLDQGTDDERLSHQRLELERANVAERRESKSRAGQEGAKKRWGDRSPPQTAWQNDGSAMPVPLAERCDSIGKTIAPNPYPNPYPFPEETHTHTHSADAGFAAGWAAEAWGEFVARWNATERAARWEPLLAPSGWVDHAASPGWLSKAEQAMARLPRCEYFDRPLAVTKFFEFVDRILAGEFDAPKSSGSPRRRQAAGGKL